MASQFIYEVTVQLPETLKDTALRYMRDKHIAEVLAHPAFSHAEFFSSCANEAFSFTTHYYVCDSDAFTRYVEQDSAPLKEDVKNFFAGVELVVSRRLLELPFRVES